MHKKIGVIGGLSPESTVTYYEYFTRTYAERYGDFGFPEIVIFSVNFQNYVDWGDSGDWGRIAEDMIKAAKSLGQAGADFGLIATNTMHIAFDEVQAAVSIPFINLIDATADAIKERGFSKVGLLGTKFTMEGDFYRDRLTSNGVTAIIPNDSGRQDVNRIIYEELVRGKIEDASRARYVEVIGQLGESGAEGVILGCTEIPLLVSEKDCSLPLFDTTTIHAEKALQYAISG